MLLQKQNKRKKWLWGINSRKKRTKISAWPGIYIALIKCASSLSQNYDLHKIWFGTVTKDEGETIDS